MSVNNEDNKVICSSSYDDLTRFLRTILKEYADEKPEFKFFDFKESPIKFDSFVEQNSINKESLIVFGGHGSPNAIFVVGENGEKYSVFYDKEYFKLGPRLLVAFACFAGKELGKNFVDETESAFFGYSKKIRFIDKEPYRQEWKSLIHSIIDMIVKEEDVNGKIVTEIKSMYEKNLTEYETGMRSSDELALMMRMFLREQIDGIIPNT